MWNERVTELYDNYDLMQGNNVSYKNSLIKFCDFLETNRINYFVEELENKEKKDNVNSHVQKGLDLYLKIKNNELIESYNRVNKHFTKLQNNFDANHFVEFYQNIKEEIFFKIFNQHSCACELTSFFNQRLIPALTSSTKSIWVGKVDSLETLKELKENGIYRIYFNEIDTGDLSKYNSVEELVENNIELKSENGNTKTHTKNALWQFANEMKVNDEIIVAKGNHTVLSKATVVGKYYYNEELKVHEISVIYDDSFSGKISESFVRKTLTNITQYTDFIDSINNDILGDNNTNTDVNEYVSNSKQLIIDGAPGTGKSYYVDNEIIKKDSDYVNRVTFYPDYEYHNFIGNIIPKVEGNQVSYQFNKGNFTETLEHALCNPETKHYLVIEELSRGNAAAIFGDVFQLLDRNKEGWSEYEISNSSIYSNLCKKAQDVLREVYGENKVGIPKNMSIICTINSSDQNVYPLDTAFKRRFNYMIMSTESDNEDVKFDISLGIDNAIKQPWNEFYQKLNEFIIDKMELNEDKQIGPFFIRQGDETKEIQTKLAMYLWNDINKVHTMSNIKVFNNNIKTLAKLDEKFRNGTKEELHDILTDEFKAHFNIE